MFKKFISWIKKVLHIKSHREAPQTIEAPEQLQIGEDVVGTVNEELRWKIWMTHYNEDGEVIGYGVYPTDYAHKSSATRRARQLVETDSLRTCIVSQTNPWGTCEEEAYDEGGYGYVKCE